MTQDRIDGIEEIDIRAWFCTVDLDQAEDTYRVVEGILLGRRAGVPAKKTRSDKGKSRKANGQESLIGEQA